MQMGLLKSVEVHVVPFNQLIHLEFKESVDLCSGINEHCFDWLKYSDIVLA
jgi:hypothetical protein